MYFSVNGFSRLVKYIPSARNLFPNNYVLKSFLGVGENARNARAMTRSLWYLCENRRPTVNPLSSATLGQSWTNKCSCDRSFHTEGDKELAQFLNEEINSETKAQKFPKLPALDDFESKLDESEVLLTRQFNNETITLKINVNNSVDAEDTDKDVDPTQDKNPQVGEMKSKPDFTVEIEKKGRILSFHCCFSDPISEEASDDYNDTFQITEVALYEGDWKDSTYSVSADIMDGYLYDLLMNMLEERGVSNDFALKLIEFCTSYEHKLYIGLLERMKQFISEK